MNSTTIPLRPVRFTLIILGIFLAVLRIGPPTRAEGVAPPSPMHTIEFETISNWSVIPVHVGDSRSLRCILDTGMPNGLFIFDPSLGAELNLNYSTTVPVKGAGAGSATANIAMGETLRLADLEFTNQNIIVLTEAGELADMGIDAVIGASVFNRFMVEIDFKNQRLQLHDPNTVDTARFGDEIPMEVVATKPHIKGEVSIDEGPPIPVSLMIDTGANTVLNLFPPSKPGLNKPSKSIPTVVASGVGGSVRGVVGRVSSLQLGKHRFNNAIASFSDNPIGSENGVIGMGMLRRFIATFDFPNNRLFLRPTATIDDPFEFGMAGINVRPHSDGGVLVMDVIEGSPAAGKDIRADDLIVAIDGKQLDPNDGLFIQSKMRQDGKMITFTIVRDGDSFDTTLQLRRLI